jgi:hypothetical protein
MSMSHKEEIQGTVLPEKIQDYEPLIEELNHWQAIFEMALDEAARYLTPEQFPAEDLRASLEDMCDLIRDILKKSIQ